MITESRPGWRSWEVTGRGGDRGRSSAGSALCARRRAHRLCASVFPRWRDRLRRQRNLHMWQLRRAARHRHRHQRHNRGRDGLGRRGGWRRCRSGRHRLRGLRGGQFHRDRRRGTQRACRARRERTRGPHALHFRRRDGPQASRGGAWRPERRPEPTARWAGQRHSPRRTWRRQGRCASSARASCASATTSTPWRTSCTRRS